MSAHERAVEANEMVQMLAATQYGPIIRMMQAEPDCFTHGGRINCAAVARHMSCDAGDVRKMVVELRGMTGP